VTLGARLKFFLWENWRALTGRFQPKAPDETVTAPAHSAKFLDDARKGVREHLLLVVLFSAAINVLYLAPSLFMLQVYDRVLPTGATLTLVFLGLVLIVAMVVMARLEALRGRLLARASLRIERLGARAIMQETFSSKQRGGPTPAGMRQLDTLRQGLTSPATIGLLDLPWTPLFIFICFALHFWIGMLAIGGAALILGIALLNERASRRSLKEMTGQSNQFYAAHDGDLAAAESLRALGSEPAVLERRLRLREEYANTQTDATMVSADFSALTKSVRLALQSAALGLGAYLAVERQISAGAVIAASILTARAYAPVEQIVSGWRQVAMAHGAWGALRAMFVNAEAQIERTPMPIPKGRIQVENVSGAPPGATALSVANVSFAVNPGELIGIVGPSGAGKTTLARLLANATPPKLGAVRIDGARYADWDPSALARHIGYLPQRVDLTDGTVAENISRFARERGEQADEIGPKVVAAAQLAGAHEMILALPQAYETKLASGGSGISPGQAQRVALARALYDNPKIMVLDEPNAHLDSDGEVALIRALQDCKARGVSCFIVAHRAGVLGIVDKVLVLNRGQLVEFGPRENVMASITARAPSLGARPERELRP